MLRGEVKRQQQQAVFGRASQRYNLLFSPRPSTCLVSTYVRELHAHVGQSGASTAGQCGGMRTSRRDRSNPVMLRPSFDTPPNSTCFIDTKCQT